MIGICVWVVLLSPAVMSVVQVFHLIWCWVWLVSLWECLVSHLLRCDLTMVRFDVVIWARFGMVETVEFRQVMWFVMLESAKDRILGVDTLGQHVPPCVRYGTACLLIMNAIDCMSCSDEWGWASFLVSNMWHTLWSAWTTWCKRGHLCGKP